MVWLVHPPGLAPSKAQAKLTPGSLVNPKVAVSWLVLEAGVVVKAGCVGAVRSTVQLHATGALTAPNWSTAATRST